jgi:hypothetical protein
MVHVASLQRSCGVEVKNGRVDKMNYFRLFYSNFTVFTVLDQRAF